MLATYGGVSDFGLCMVVAHPPTYLMEGPGEFWHAFVLCRDKIQPSDDRSPGRVATWQCQMNVLSCPVSICTATVQACTLSIFRFLCSSVAVVCWAHHHVHNSWIYHCNFQCSAETVNSAVCLLPVISAPYPFLPGELFIFATMSRE